MSNERKQTVTLAVQTSAQADLLMGRQVQRLDAEQKKAAKAFTDEFVYFCVNRGEVRRFLPTPDQFPLFFQLIDAAKEYYLLLRRSVRNNIKDIPFHYFGRDWLIRVEFVRVCRTDERYLTIRNPDKRILATVPILVVESWDSI